MDFRIWAFLSAIFAGATALLAKKGTEGISSNFALAIRVLVVATFAWMIVFLRGEAKAPVSTATLGWLFTSGIATGLSWLCYFQALKLGPVSQVAPIDKLSFVIALLGGVVFLGERPTVTTFIGAGFIVFGVILTLR